MFPASVLDFQETVDDQRLHLDSSHRKDAGLDILGRRRLEKELSVRQIATPWLAI
jgi:hypothetical protein